jgi:hypothetical protein
MAEDTVTEDGPIHSVDDWILEASRFLRAYQDRLAKAKPTAATQTVSEQVAHLLDSVPVGDAPEAPGFSARLADMLGVKDDQDDIVEAVEEMTARLDSVAESFGVERIHVTDVADESASVRNTLEPLAEALGLTSVQLGLIGESFDPVGAAKRELAAANVTVGAEVPL